MCESVVDVFGKIGLKIVIEKLILFLKILYFDVGGRVVEVLG